MYSHRYESSCLKSSVCHYKNAKSRRPWTNQYREKRCVHENRYNSPYMHISERESSHVREIERNAWECLMRSAIAHLLSTHPMLFSKKRKSENKKHHRNMHLCIKSIFIDNHNTLYKVTLKSYIWFYRTMIRLLSIINHACASLKARI